MTFHGVGVSPMHSGHIGMGSGAHARKKIEPLKDLNIPQRLDLTDTHLF